MKKAMRYSFMGALVLLALSVAFKVFQLQGAPTLLLMGTLSLGLALSLWLIGRVFR
ncbi:MAG: hypothetical protein ACO3DK_00800 [Bacteroidia bacterium]